MRPTRFDEFVHNHPRFYRWKLDALKIAKRAIYIASGQDKKIAQMRDEIERKNKEIVGRYFDGMKVLEIGCGEGSSLAGLSAHGLCQCVGVDLSEVMIKAAAGKHRGPSYCVMDSSSLAFKDKEFDVVLFNYVLHHVANVDDTIVEAKRVGKKIVIYECCTWNRQPFKYISWLYWKLTDGGYDYLSLSEWQARFGMPVLAEIRGRGLVRYGMCVFHVT